MQKYTPFFYCRIIGPYPGIAPGGYYRFAIAIQRDFINIMCTKLQQCLLLSYFISDNFVASTKITTL